MSNFIVVDHNDPGRVGVAFDVSWQSGRDPVYCRVYIDDVLRADAQCGTRSSNQFYDIAPGEHKFYATVHDREGVFNDPMDPVHKHIY